MLVGRGTIILTNSYRSGLERPRCGNVAFVADRRTGMELSKELKEKIEKAETKEEAKKILEEAGVVLDDAELDQVAGGLYFGGGRYS